MRITVMNEKYVVMVANHVMQGSGLRPGNLLRRRERKKTGGTVSNTKLEKAFFNVRKGGKTKRQNALSSTVRGKRKAMYQKRKQELHGVYEEEKGRIGG